MTVDAAREAIVLHWEKHPEYREIDAAVVLLAAEMTVVRMLRVDIARERVARYLAERELASIRLERARESLRQAETESRGERS